MEIDEFWEIYDLEVRRYNDRQQETPVNPDEPVGPLIGEPPRSLPPTKVVAKPGPRQRRPEKRSTYKNRKLRAISRKVNNTRNSLADKVDAEDLDLEGQTQEVLTISRIAGRMTRPKVSSTVSSSQQRRAIRTKE